MTINARLFIALIIALALSILPLPGLIVGMRPPWVLLLVLYVQLYMPERFSVLQLIILGLILDSLLATILGEHTFALSTVSWLASTKARRFRFFSISQQMALMGVAVLIYQLCIYIIDSVLGNFASILDVLGSTIISILIWPWIRLVAQDSLLAGIPARLR